MHLEKNNSIPLRIKKGQNPHKGFITALLKLLLHSFSFILTILA